jgi:hypothetical protein
MINPAQATQQYMSGMMVNPQQMAALDINRQIAAMGSNAGAMIGTGLGRLFGGRSPEEAQQEQMQGMLGGVDMNDPDSLMEVAQRIQSVNPAAAQELAQRAMTMRKTQVETRAKEFSFQQEQQMRRELAELPADATDADREAILMKYADVGKMLDISARRQTTQEAADARMEAARQAHQDRLELARMNNASREDIAAMNRQFQMQMMEMRQEMKPQRTMPPSLQAREDEDFEIIDGAEGVIADIAPIIQNLTPDPTTGKTALDLSRFANLKLQTKAYFGSKDPEVQGYQQLERNLTRFVNESLRLNKGVQTEGDAIRAANEVQAAFSKNNTESMRKALEELKKINERAANNRKQQIDRRRKSQNQPAFFNQGRNKAAGPAGEDDILNQAEAILRGEQ